MTSQGHGGHVRWEAKISRKLEDGDDVAVLQITDRSYVWPVESRLFRWTWVLSRSRVSFMPL